ncbi:hypothetical protein H8356DRAFT_1324449 [Neocallimastix lanati (nom. inval.)]|nr:hypothetical protein H8356DRAFT_1324449 [Neocallimastix sp. JGI-2020a]
MSKNTKRKSEIFRYYNFNFFGFRNNSRILESTSSSLYNNSCHSIVALPMFKTEVVIWAKGNITELNETRITFNRSLIPVEFVDFVTVTKSSVSKIRTLVQWLVILTMTNTSWCKPIEFSPFCVSIPPPANPSPQYLYAISQTFYRTFRNSTLSITFGNRWVSTFTILLLKNKYLLFRRISLLIPIPIITLSVSSYLHYYIIQSFESIILPDNPNPMVQEKPSSYTELEELSSLVLHSTNRFGSRLGAYVTEGVRLKLYSILKFYFVLTRGTSYNSTDGFFYSCESIVYTTSKATEVGLCFPNNKLDIIKNLTILLPFVYKTLTIDFICVITKRLKELIV